jgi:hypothetical protein
LELFEKYDATRSFNVIDQILLEDQILDDQMGGALIKYRATLDKEYDKMGDSGTNDSDSDSFMSGASPALAEETEFGFVGFDAPLG